MTLYRDHGGSLDASMETVQEFETFDQLAAYVKESFQKLGDNGEGHIACGYYCYDERIDWDQWIVTYNGSVVGFTKGEIK